MDILATSPQTSCIVKRLLDAYNEPEPDWDGNYVLICMPDGLTIWCHPDFASGYHRAMMICFDLYEQGSLFLPSDLEFTALIDEQLRGVAIPTFVNEWRTGFVFAWVLMWHRPIEPHQLKQLQAQASSFGGLIPPQDFKENQEENS